MEEIEKYKIDREISIAKSVEVWIFYSATGINTIELGDKVIAFVSMLDRLCDIEIIYKIALI